MNQQLEHFLAHVEWASISAQQFVACVDACAIDYDVVRQALHGRRLADLNGPERADLWSALKCEMRP